jgi:predicted transcriptional regulator
MAEGNEFDFNEPADLFEDEDEETMAGIERGIRDAEAGRTIPVEEVRKLMAQWITTASSSRKKR